MKKFLEVWEDAANSVGGGGVSMPSDAVHDKKKKKVPRIITYLKYVKKME